MPRSCGAKGNFHRDDSRLEGWLELLPAGRHTIEFRHASWFVPEVLETLRTRGVALTVGDHPARPFQSYGATADWRFVRFHYGARGRAGNYSATEISEWAQRIARWRATEDVYVYFNNDWNSYAPANAKLLLRRLSERPYTTARSTGSPKRSEISRSSRSSR